MVYYREKTMGFGQKTILSFESSKKRADKLIYRLAM